MNAIFAIFWDFNGVGQLIATNLLTKRVWISSWLGGRPIDCVLGYITLKAGRSKLAILTA